MLYTSKGAAIELGRELGRGGEGSVFEVSPAGNHVAKIYHKHNLPDAKKQAKLSFMAQAADPQLISYLAWPLDTLHAVRGGPVLGFLMPKVTGKEPIHMVYSPAHRRQDHPKAAWDYLLFVARNTAACFETVHKHGHVIGDVNQDSIMAGRDSKVMLIDSDSFQVNANGTMHLCEVGVPHFTPPELQSLSTFHGLTRTTNHDNFGLALLIFHVLFGGRHPYSGVPLKNGVGDALEADIKNFRYAYARDGQSRGIAPPPRSIPVSVLPDATEAMFHAAFTERGSQGHRPTAQQWVAALDALRPKLRKCAASSMHVYPDHLGKCPWCELEQQGVVYFIDLGATVTPQSTGFVLAQVWAIIQAVPAPLALSLPTPANFAVKARPLPKDVSSARTANIYRAIGFCIAIAICVLAPKAIFWGIVIAIGTFLMANNVGSSERKAEERRRATERRSAQQEYDALLERAQRDAGPSSFQSKKAELAKLRDEHMAMPQYEQVELDKLRSTAQERQKQKFLEGCFIDTATISGVGPARKAALRSFGIETAADVSRNKVAQIKGFGEGLTRAVVDWKASCERRFVFNAANAVSASDRNAVRAKFMTRKVSIEAALSRGANELQQLRHRTSGQVATFKPLLENAAKRLAQAEADLKVL